MICSLLKGGGDDENKDFQEYYAEKLSELGKKRYSKTSKNTKSPITNENYTFIDIVIGFFSAYFTWKDLKHSKWNGN